MSRKARRFNNQPTNGKDSHQEIISLFDSDSSAEESMPKANDEPGNNTSNISSRFSPFTNLKTAENRRRLLYPVLGIILVALLGLGVMGKNGWLPHTDALSGKRTGWFGQDLQANNSAAGLSSTGSAGSSTGSSTGTVGNLLSFDPTPTPAPTPQLSKEYIYAGSRMLAVEDAGASAAAPTDLAVWRPSEGNWYILNSSYPNTSNQQMTITQFGSNNDKPVRGDYDGDGKTDLSVFRPSEGNWYQMRSAGNQLYTIQLGASGDTTAPADYDGDGKTDIAVFRPSTQYWYIIRSSDSTLQSFQFGVSTDKPVPADYDGDGKADFAQYRQSEANWYWLSSANNNAFVATHFGLAGTTDEAETGDYDGDGKFDFAVWRTTDNTWYINNSSSNTTTAIQWGDQLIDKPVQGDFDADGKTDIAVWRNSGSSVGLWQIRNSSTGQTRTASWGTTNDIPVPAPYRR